MRLKGESGRAFELVISGYEHPDVTEDWWDSNWLVVAGQVSGGDETWRFVDPCVTTFELAGLADWLEELDARPTELRFTEPDLAFGYVPWPAPTLQVRFAREAAPPSAAGSEGVTVEFPLSPGHGRAVAAELRRALADYPIRGGAA
jgi:hypothetical protein